MLIYDVLHKETIYHTIANDLRALGVKYRFKKCTFKTERLEGARNISRKVFKTSLSYQPLDVVNLSSGGIVHVPVFVSQASCFLEKYITQEGLFRKAGSQLRQKELISRLDAGETLGEKNHAIDVANCLKTFFRELPEPLIPYAYHDLFVHCAMLKTRRVQALLLACILLPPHHLNTLAFFMEFLKKTSLYEKQNKMGIDNLTKVVGPNVMPLQEATMSAVQNRLELHLIIVKILIENAESIGVLPDHISQAISTETIGSTDNELDVSESQLRSKSRKKKHRSGSLTRKPHLSASNLNLRMINGLKKMVGKGGLPDDNVSDTQQPQPNIESLFEPNLKPPKKRKVGERLDPSSTKKKRVTERTDKSKKLRLSLDRFVPKNKLKLNGGDSESSSTHDSNTDRRWSSVSNSVDSQRTHRTYSDGYSHLRLLLKDNEVSKEYNNVFVDADVNLSDDSDEQVLLTKNDPVNNGRRRTKLSSSSDESKTVDEYDETRLHGSKKRLIVGDFDNYSAHVKPKEEQTEEYLTVPKSEYEDIKNRVSAIENRISQELGCSNSEENGLLPHSVKKVQTAYEKTLEEARIESTTPADYLARRLGKELKIRRSGEHKIIRSPSARKIGNLRRRSQEKVMNRRVRRTASWNISHGVDLQSQSQSDDELINAYQISSPSPFTVDYIKEDDYGQPKSNHHWDEGANSFSLNAVPKPGGILNPYTAKHSKETYSKTNIKREKSMAALENRGRTSVRRVSSFHGNELVNTLYLTERLEKLKKTNSQQNIILDSASLPKSSSKVNEWKETALSWNDADRYFKATAPPHTPVTLTGRASIAKLRTQNAGMVLAKAKLFDECTTKVSVQGSLKKQECLGNQQVTVSSKRKEGRNSLDPSENCKKVDLCRKDSKSAKSKSTKTIASASSPSYTELDWEPSQRTGKNERGNCYRHASRETDFYNSKLCQINQDKIISSTIPQKENLINASPVTKKGNGVLSHEPRLSIYKSDVGAVCKTPHIKKSLTVKTPKSAKQLVRKPVVDSSRRTPLKAVGQIGTPKCQSPKSILKSKNLNRHA